MSDKEYKLRNIEQRILELQAQKRKLKSVEIKQQRKDDTRRKILLGAFLLHMSEHNDDAADLIKNHLTKFINRGNKGEKSKAKDLELFKEILK
ncbi:MAG: mobilization protein [Rhizobiales bacterium]|nr:mobilization protein [Hyphomicrobiales bacterium]